MGSGFKSLFRIPRGSGLENSELFVRLSEVTIF